jgi:hypothetical protein
MYGQPDMGMPGLGYKRDQRAVRVGPMVGIDMV